MLVSHPQGEEKRALACFGRSGYPRVRHPPTSESLSRSPSCLTRPMWLPLVILSLTLFVFLFYLLSLFSYEHYDEVQHGDLNWIIPNKLLAFGSPVDPQWTSGDTAIGKTKLQTHDPSFYIKIFQEFNVTAVVRTCKPEYRADEFVEAGIEHHDLYFVDGSVPHMDLVDKFMHIVTHSEGAVAVHCKAGLGRTGTLMCAYLMRYFGFSAAESIAYCRIRRPGSVIGEQQVFLSSIEAQLCRLFGTFEKKKRSVPDSGREDYAEDSDASSTHEFIHAPKAKKKKLLAIIEDDVSNSSTATL